MSEKHSKGPWSIFVPDGPKETFGIDCANGDAVVFFGSTPEEGILRREDANLIAAAPELLGALSEMVNRFEALREVIGCTEESGLSDRARAAIKKATGTAP